MNAFQAFRCFMAQIRDNVSSPVAALRGPSAVRIAQAPHQLCPRARGAMIPPFGLRRLPGEAVPRECRHDEVERILRRAAVRLGVNELVNDVPEFEDRAGPAVRKHKSQRVLVLRPKVQEVDLHAVDGRRELGIRIQ